jgi:hypothetical protein
MRSFIAAVVVMIILAVGFGLCLDLLQEPVSSAFSTGAARVDPSEAR